MALVERGLERSATFRDLFQRLGRTDVIVHVRLDSGHLEGTGYNQFVTTAGAYRFVRIGLVVREINNDAVALLGHELQHAVELAEAPTVTDTEAYARLYERIGYRGCQSRHIRCFDTHEANRVGRVVREELRARRSPGMAGAAAARDLVVAWLTQVKALANKRRMH